MRTLVQLFHRVSINDVYRTIKLGQFHVPCVKMARELASAINRAGVDNNVTAQLAWQLCNADGALITVPVNAVNRLVFDLCAEGIIDRDALPEAGSQDEHPVEETQPKVRSARVPFRPTTVDTDGQLSARAHTININGEDHDANGGFAAE